VAAVTSAECDHHDYVEITRIGDPEYVYRCNICTAIWTRRDPDLDVDDSRP
jgi:hypothetical protein